MEVPTQFCWAGNRGALTTTFTPPSTCLATTSVYLSGYLAPPSAQETVYYVGWVPTVPDYLPNDVNDPCLPPPTTPLNLVGQAMVLFTWYLSKRLHPGLTVYPHFRISVIPLQHCLKALRPGFAVHRKPRLLF